jgi:hypothetical protein
MTLIKKRDVKDYFAARRLKGSPIHIVPANKPATTAPPETERAPVENTPPGFDQDFIADHSSSGAPLSSAGRSNGPKTAKAPAGFGRESL